MNTQARRPIPSAPGYSIDQIGQVYKTDGGRAVRVPSDATGRVVLVHGTSVHVANRRELLLLVWPEELTEPSILDAVDRIDGEAQLQSARAQLVTRLAGHGGIVRA